MAPRLPALGCIAAPMKFVGRIARPFSTTPAALQSKDEASFFLNLDKEKKPRVHGADRVRSLIGDRQRMQNRSEMQMARQRTEAQAMRDRKVSEDYMKQLPRRWHSGEVYAPRDLSPNVLSKFKQRGVASVDVTDKLDVNPLDLYKNFSMISEFTTYSGMIKPASETGLRARNQRKMAKAIRRVMGMGIHPSVHHHPEIILTRLRRGMQ